MGTPMHACISPCAHALLVVRLMQLLLGLPVAQVPSGGTVPKTAPAAAASAGAPATDFVKDRFNNRIPEKVEIDVAMDHDRASKGLMLLKKDAAG